MTTSKYIKSQMKVHDITHVQLADILGISPPTLRSRFKTDNWRWEEIKILIKVLHIKNPQDIFLKLDVSLNETNGSKTT